MAAGDWTKTDRLYFHELSQSDYPLKESSSRMNTKLLFPIAFSLAFQVLAVEIEPNDSVSQATALGIENKGQISNSSDIDYFYFDIDNIYTIPLIFSCAKAYINGWVFKIYNSEGFLQSSYDIIGFQCRQEIPGDQGPYKVDFTPGSIGRYYLSVEPRNDVSFESNQYTITIGGAYNGIMSKANIVDKPNQAKDTVKVTLKNCGSSPQASLSITGTKLDVYFPQTSNLPIKIQLGGLVCSARVALSKRTNGASTVYKK